MRRYPSVRWKLTGFGQLLRFAVYRGYLDTEKFVHTYFIEIGGRNSHALGECGTQNAQHEHESTDRPHGHLIG